MQEASGLKTWWQKFAISIPQNIRTCQAKQGHEAGSLYVGYS